MGLDRKRIMTYAAVGVVVLAVGVRYLTSHQGAASEAQGIPLVSESVAQSSEAPGDSGMASPSPVDLIVDVRGAVSQPGVYHLPPGSRVCDLVEAAGGALPAADLAAVNLAARLADGQQVVVPKRGQSVGPAPGATGGSTTSGAPGPGAPVNLNTATLEQLDTLPGVGPSTAQKIVDYRDAHGGFRSIDDLKNVSGIGDVRFEALKDLVSV